jgi:hypothetical protein
VEPSQELHNPGTNIHNPSIDSTDCHETVVMLCLAIAQIGASLKDSDNSCSDLTDTFTSINQQTQALSKLCEDALSDSQTEERNALHTHSKEIEAKVHQAIVATQFFDRLAQKLSNVNDYLLHLGSLLGDADRHNDPQAWRELQTKIRGRYSMEGERELFDHIMEGGTIDEAIQNYMKHFDSSNGSDDSDHIELF